MGKASKLLTIWVHPTMIHTIFVRDLFRKGHTINAYDNTCDLIIGPNCWRYFEGFKPTMFAEAIKEMRLIKYGPPKVRAKSQPKEK